MRTFSARSRTFAQSWAASFFCSASSSRPSSSTRSSRSTAAATPADPASSTYPPTPVTTPSFRPSTRRWWPRPPTMGSSRKETSSMSTATRRWVGASFLANSATVTGQSGSSRRGLTVGNLRCVNAKRIMLGCVNLSSRGSGYLAIEGPT